MFTKMFSSILTFYIDSRIDLICRISMNKFFSKRDLQLVIQKGNLSFKKGLTDFSRFVI